MEHLVNTTSSHSWDVYTSCVTFTHLPLAAQCHRAYKHTLYATYVRKIDDDGLEMRTHDENKITKIIIFSVPPRRLDTTRCRH